VASLQEAIHTLGRPYQQRTTLYEFLGSWRKNYVSQAHFTLSRCQRRTGG
jgi:hypothetical protein